MRQYDLDTEISQTRDRSVTVSPVRAWMGVWWPPEAA